MILARVRNGVDPCASSRRFSSPLSYAERCRLAWSFIPQAAGMAADPTRFADRASRRCHREMSSLEGRGEGLRILSNHNQKIQDIAENIARPNIAKRKRNINKHLREYLHGGEYKNATLTRIAQIRNRYHDVHGVTSREPQGRNIAAQVMLKIPDAPTNAQGPNELSYRCAACHRHYATRRCRAKRRKLISPCAIQPPNINKIYILFPNDNCNQIFSAQEK